MSADPYLVLGVARDADAETVRLAYRRAAQKWHPDRHAGSVEAHRRFVAIAEAYAILSSPERRSRWDASAHTPEPEQEAPFTPGPRWSSWSVPPDEPHRAPHRSTGPAVGQGTPSPGDTATVDVLWPLPDALEGGTARVSARIATTCPRCRGRRTDCRLCGGTGQRLRLKTWEVSLPAGTPDGARVRLRGAGHEGPRFSEPGDVEIVVRWTRKGGWRWHADRLEQTLQVTRRDLAAGHLTLRTPSGRKGVVPVDSGLASGTWLRIPGIGMARAEGGHEPAWVKVLIRG